MGKARNVTHVGPGADHAATFAHGFQGCGHKSADGCKDNGCIKGRQRGFGVTTVDREARGVLRLGQGVSCRWTNGEG